MEFANIGDVVILKSNSPRMTVTAVYCQPSGYVDLTYFLKEDFHTIKLFPIAALQKV